MPPTRTLALDNEAWEAYRLYQRDLLIGCIEDATMMMRRMKLDNDEAERRMLITLLWEKRCQPWKYYRDEHRALIRR